MDRRSDGLLLKSVARTATMATAIVAMVLMAACGAPAAPSVEDEGAQSAPGASRSCVPALHGDLETLDPTGQVVTFWHPYGGSRESLILKMVDEFNRTNPAKVTVLAESSGDASQLDVAVAEGVGAGRVPDLSTLPPGQVAAHAAEGVLAPLECYAGDPAWGYSEAGRNDFHRFALDEGFISQLGARYGWPFHTSTVVLYYNLSWLAELGFEGPPETWEAFSEMACAASQQPFSDFRGEGTIAGYEFSVDSRQFTAFVLGRGGAVANANNSGYVFGGPEGLDALLFLRDIADRGCATSTRVRGTERVDFGAGRALFTIAPAHLLPSYQKAVEEGAGFEWGVARPPHSADRESTSVQIYGPSFTVFRTSPETQLAAWTFIRWLNEPEQQARWATSTSYYPTRLKATDLMADYRAENPQYGAVLDLVGDEYANEPAVVGHDECSAAIEQMLDAVLAGGDAQTALQAASERCNAVLQDDQ